MSRTPPSSPSSNSKIIPISPLTPLVYDRNNYARSSNEHDGIPVTNDDVIARKNDKKILEAHLTRIDNEKKEIERKIKLLKRASPGFIQKSKLGLDIQQLKKIKNKKRNAEEQQAYQPYDNPEQFWMSNSTEDIKKQNIINKLDEEIQQLDAEYEKIVEYIKKNHRDELERLGYGKKRVKKGGKKSKKTKKSRVRKTNKCKGKTKKIK